jgi:pimeloyl-ACP methyl ester carboxylesterase
MQTVADDVRQLPDGDYVTLGDGVTHFRRAGPASGPPILLLHGATVPCWEFDLLVPHLVRAGFHVLSFDLYSHGRSGCPDGDHSLERFVRQTIELVEATQFPRPAVILGHSMGAAIASAVAVRCADWASRLVLVAPMLDFSASTRWSTLFRCPGVGELLMRFVGLPALVRRRRARYEHIGQPHLTDWFIAQASYDRLGRALLSMVRSAALGDQTPRYSALRALARDVLVIAGADDTVIPREDIARIREMLPAHRYREIEGAAHNLLLTHPEIVATALLETHA